MSIASAPSEFKGCYHDQKKQQSRDLTTLKGTDMTFEACEASCKADGFAYFGRQWLRWPLFFPTLSICDAVPAVHRECWCGASYGAQGPAEGCECDAENIGPSVTTACPTRHLNF